MFSIIQAAGWPIWPLIASSILAMALIIERFLSLKTQKIAPPRLLDEALSVSRTAVPSLEIVTQLERNSALGEVLASGFRALHTDPRCSEADLRATMEGAGRVVAHRLERYLNTLGSIASAAPLMGLFGTVVGMIEIFGSQNATGTGANPTQLAHGISIALYNTGFGLAIAMPSLVFYRHFRALVDSFIIDMEQQAVKFVDIVHSARK